MSEKKIEKFKKVKVLGDPKDLLSDFAPDQLEKRFGGTATFEYKYGIEG